MCSSSLNGGHGMAAKKVKRAVAARNGVSADAAETGGARVFPLAALRAALGTEVDRVRRYGGYTLILRRGRAVAAVIPYEELERLTMQDRNGKDGKDRKNTNARSAHAPDDPDGAHRRGREHPCGVCQGRCKASGAGPSSRYEVGSGACPRGARGAHATVTAGIKGER